MKCRNRWMAQGCAWVVLIAGWCLSAQAWAGSLDSLAAPTSTNSAMYTLEDIYNKLDTRLVVTKRTGAFTEPSEGPTNGTMHTLNDLMAMAILRAPVRKTGQTTSYATGSDGNLKKGGTWPNPRFRIAGESGDATNCVIDNLTGLMWARNADVFNGTNVWGVAVTNCNNLVYGGYSDWRLPNVVELRSLISYKFENPALCDVTGILKHTEDNPFTNVRKGTTDYYWSSTSYAVDVSKAWPVCVYNGDSYPHNHGLKTLGRFAWPVRGPD